MIYGYIRVSTDKQTLENQRFEIENYCVKVGMKIDKWVEEVISSKVELEDRKLGKLLKKLNKNDIIISSEISRLGRNLLQVMGILHLCMLKECQVWTTKENYKLGADISSKVLAFAFALSAEIERQLISQRTKESLARVKAQGKHLGRPFGCTPAFAKIKRHRSEILSLAKQKVPKTQIAKMFGVDRSTIRRFLNVQK
jgi:DNA invertase Pin-like site-specific DNA recombinase